MASVNPDLSKPTCRVCLQNSGEEMSSVFDVSVDLNNIYIFEQIELCAGIKVLRHEKLPSLICGECYECLKISYKFRTICYNSNEYLKGIIVAATESTNSEISLKENALSISERYVPEETFKKKVTRKTILSERLSSHPQNKKNKTLSPSNSHKNSEDIAGDDNFDKVGDGTEIWLDTDYHAVSRVENLEICIDKMDLEIEKAAENPNGIEISIKHKKKSKSNAKEKISNDDLPEFMEISTDATAIKQETKSSNKSQCKEKQEKKSSNKSLCKEKQPHLCDICGNVYPRRSSLEFHRRRHRDVKPYKCEICEYAFYCTKELMRHMRKHTGSKPYKCNYCSRAFGDKSTLIKHERIHRNERPYKCETCGKTFTYSNVLKIHKFVHTGEKPYTICEYAFYCTKELMRHMRKHTGSKPYKCNYCSRAFGDKSTLIKHERIHRNERPYKCETCGKTFTYSNVLKIHKFVHTGEKPYTCELCDKGFTRPHHLRAHLETLLHQNDPRSIILLQNIRKNKV